MSIRRRFYSGVKRRRRNITALFIGSHGQSYDGFLDSGDEGVNVIPTMATSLGLQAAQGLIIDRRHG